MSSCADIVSYKDHSIRTKLTANNTQGKPQHRVSWRLDTDNKNNSSPSSTQSDKNCTTSNTAQASDVILHAPSCEPAQCSAQPQRDNSALNNVQPKHSAVSDIVISDVRSITPCMNDVQSSDNSAQVTVVPEYSLQPRQTTNPNANELQHSKWNELLTQEISKEQLQQLLIHSYDDNARLQNINRRLHSIHQPLAAVPPATNSNGPRARMNINEETVTLRAEQSAHNQNLHQQQLQQPLIVKSNTEGRQKRTYTRRQPPKPKHDIEADLMAKQLHNYQQIQLFRPPPPPYPGQPNNPGGMNELLSNGRNLLAIHQYSKKIPSTLAPPPSYRSTLSHMANPTVPRLSTDTGQPTSRALDLRYSVNDIPITQVHSSTNTPLLTRTTDTLPPSPVVCKYSPSTTTMHSPIQSPVDKLVTKSRVEHTAQTENKNTKQKTLEIENRETRIGNPVQSPTPVVHSSTLVEAKSPALPATIERVENQETQGKRTISVETQTAFDTAVSHSETEQSPTICKISTDRTSNNTAVASNADTPRSHKPTIRNRARARRYCQTPLSVKFRRLVIRHNFRRRRIASRASRTPVTSHQDHSYNRTTQLTNDNKNIVKEETSPLQNNNKPLPTTRRQDNANTSMETPDRMNIPVNFYSLSDQQPVYASLVINQGLEALQLTQAYIDTVQNNQEAMQALQQSLRELIANVNTSDTVKGEHNDGKSTTATVDNSKISHTEQILQQFLANQKNIRTEFVIRHELVTTVSAATVKQQLTNALEKLAVTLKNMRDSELNVSSASATTTVTAEGQHVKTREQSTSTEQEITGQQDTISSSNNNTSINSNNNSSSDSTKSSSDCNEPTVNVQLPWSKAKAKYTEQSAYVSAVDHSLPSTSTSVPSLVDSNQSSNEEQVTGPSQDNSSTTAVNTTSETQDTTTVSKDERLNVLHKYALCKLEERKLDNNNCQQQQQQQQRPVTNTREDIKIVRELLDNGVQIEYSIPMHTAAEVNNNVTNVNPVQNISARDTTSANNPNTTDVCKELQRPHNHQQQQVQTPISTTTTHNQQPTVITANQPRLQQIVSQPREVRVTPAVSHNNNQGNQSAQLTNRTDLPYTITRPPPAATNTSHSDISLPPVSLVAQGTGGTERQDSSHMPLQLTSSRMDDILLMIPTASKPNIHLYAPQPAASEQRSSENERLLCLPACNIPEYQHVTTQPATSTPYLNKRQVPVTTSAGNTRKRARTSYTTNIPEAVPTVALPAAVATATAAAPRVVEPMRPADFLAAVDQRLNNTDNLIRTLINKKKDRKRNSSTATTVRDEEVVSQSSATSLDSYNPHTPFNPSQTSINQHHTPRLSSFNVPAYQRPVYPNVQMIRPQLYHGGEHLQYRPPPPPAAWLSARIPAPPPAREPLHVPVRQAESPLTLLSTMVQEHPRTSGDRARRQSETFQAALQYNTEHSTAYMNSLMAQPKQESISSQRHNHTADSAQPHPELYRQFLNFIQQSGLQVNNHNYNGTSDNTPILYPVIEMPPFPAEVLQSKRYKTLLSKYYQKPTLMKYTNTNTNYNNSKHTTNTKCQYKYGKRVQPTSLTDSNNNIITCNNHNKNNKNTTVVRDVKQPITYPYPSDYIHRQFEKIHGKRRLSDMYNTLGIRCYGNKKQSQATDTSKDQSKELVVVAGKGKSIDSLFRINRAGGKHAMEMARARLQVKQLNRFIENNRRTLVQDSEQCIGPESLDEYIVTNIKEIHRLFEIVILTDSEQYYRSLWCMWSVSGNKRLYHFYKLVTHLQIRVGQTPFAIRIFIDLLRRKYLCTIRKLAEDQCNR